MQNFGEYIHLCRTAKSLSKSELARRSEITPQYVSDIEKGHTIPSEEVIERLVGILEMNEAIAFRLADKLPMRIIAKAKMDFYGGGGEHHDN